jgi:ubiquinone biosynthesis protein UbiJ
VNTAYLIKRIAELAAEVASLKAAVAALEARQEKRKNAKAE